MLQEKRNTRVSLKLCRAASQHEGCVFESPGCLKPFKLWLPPTVWRLNTDSKLAAGMKVNVFSSTCQPIKKFPQFGSKWFYLFFFKAFLCNTVKICGQISCRRLEPPSVKSQREPQGGFWSVRIQSNSVFVFLRNVSKEDEGWYHCEASNQDETIRSQPAFLLPAGTAALDFHFSPFCDVKTSKHLSILVTYILCLQRWAGVLSSSPQTWPWSAVQTSRSPAGLRTAARRLRCPGLKTTSFSLPQVTSPCCPAETSSSTGACR